MKPKLKICGMMHNVADVATLTPDYLGFIFYARSPRYFSGPMPRINTSIEKVGVFVNASPEDVFNKTIEYKLDVIQLHGDESAAYCQALRNDLNTKMGNPPKIWKVFPVSDDFDFKQLNPFESIVDHFLFDTKSGNYGGTGRSFNWKLLQNYPSTKPFILSGGIGPDQLPNLKRFLKYDLPLHAIDLNSKFENEPGLKDITKLKAFIHEL